MIVTDTQRERHLRWLVELTGVPTAAGKEGRVIAWVERWARERPGLAITRDAAGNLTIGAGGKRPSAAPALYFTAHLDHPAFVADRLVAPGVVEAAFRGGVMAPYFEGGRVVAHGARSEGAAGRIVESRAGEPFRRCVVEFEGGAPVDVGDVLTWALPAARVEDGRLHAPACDDLAGVAAALAALDVLEEARARGAATAAAAPGPRPDVRVLLTRAEEVGFIGAIAACREGTMPAGSTVIALENSRSFADSPIGAGPIVRVGDRMSTFSPSLTRAIAALAEKLAGEGERKVGDATPRPATTPFRWQRKLMPGGACEASAFCAWGYDATCLCLPLGNYHNMGDLERVQALTQRGESHIDAPIEPETISVEDFHGLVQLLVACGMELGAVEPLTTKLEKLYAERAFVLGDEARAAARGTSS